MLRGGRRASGLLPAGRGSELVRESAATFTESSSIELPSSRTSEASPGPLLQKTVISRTN
ncbi:hypothetical protein CU663_18975 [Pseudomonas syringae pv. actinidifoliorum]|nr:hypothetical protein [Pseudomonas syringae pv. actinidifoliorum]